MSSALKCTGTFAYLAMRAARSDTNWDSKAILMRFIEENGILTVLMLTGEGVDPFKKCEQWRVYAMQIPGRCVKSCASFAKYGVRNIQEVVKKYPCSKVELSKHAWPVVIPYAWTLWPSLNQQTPDAYVDILGIVMSKPCLDLAASVHKLNVILGNGSIQQDVYLLSSHAGIHLKTGDVVALGGARVHAWKEQRSIQLSFLTVVEINPTTRAVESFDISVSETGSKRKAIKIDALSPLTASQVLQMQTELVRTTEPNQPKTTRDFSVCGYLGELILDFFDGDAPVRDTEKEKEIIRWFTNLTNAIGNSKVVVWDRAGSDIVGASASGVWALWEYDKFKAWYWPRPAGFGDKAVQVATVEAPPWAGDATLTDTNGRDDEASWNMVSCAFIVWRDLSAAGGLRDDDVATDSNGHVSCAQSPPGDVRSGDAIYCIVAVVTIGGESEIVEIDTASRFDAFHHLLCVGARLLDVDLCMVKLLFEDVELGRVEVIRCDVWQRFAATSSPVIVAMREVAPKPISGIPAYLDPFWNEDFNGRYMNQGGEASPSDDGGCPNDSDDDAAKSDYSGAS
jgi:hypothetical protein